MFQLTRFEYLAQLFRPKRTKRTSVTKAKRAPAAPKKWKYACPFSGGSGTVYAHTKSEARSEIKKRHGIKSRVPIGSVITCA